MQALCFDAYTIPEASTLQAQAYDKFKDNLIHLISLLHAVGLATLRDDYNVENIGVRMQSPLSHLLQAIPGIYALRIASMQRVGYSVYRRAPAEWVKYLLACTRS